MWVWIAFGVALFLFVSLVVALAFARILGTIGRRISELYETEDWATLPPTRASTDVKEQQPEEIGSPNPVTTLRDRRESAAEGARNQIGDGRNRERI
jgi:hypothetical protein